MTERRFEVELSEAGIKLDRFVATRAQVSRRVARNWIRTGRVQLAGRVVRVMTRPLRAGQKVVISRELDDAKPLDAELRIIHLDSRMVVVDKPPRLLTETDRHHSPSLETEVPKLLKARGESHCQVHLVHRLDAGTSGVIVLARQTSALRRLHRAFREREVEKRYLALVGGRFADDRKIDEPIARARGTRHAVRADGRPARTRFFSLVALKEASLVEALPYTGRTHQIRVHATHLGHPLLGDRLYKGLGYTLSASPRAILRPMLHAFQLELPLMSGGSRSFCAPPPADFVEVAAWFGIDHPVLASTDKSRA